MSIIKIMEFYKGKSVLITGHTGFKGAWLLKILSMAGADITGYALEPPALSLYSLLKMGGNVNSITGDICNQKSLQSVFKSSRPQIVFHLAAQPLVRESYQNPAYTYETNVMGTVNVLECIRNTNSVRSFINVTTDKVYKNREWQWGYRENEELDGYDPYANSKSCSELVTASYARSFFEKDNRVAVSTVRAGNVIGGGDFSTDRIIPDCVRAALEGKDIRIRNPFSVRPYQHVLEPLFAYMMIAKAQYEDATLSGAYNVGPDEADCMETGRLAELFCRKWQEQTGKELHVYYGDDKGPHEDQILKLDCAKLKSVFRWKPCWNLEQAVEKIVQWTYVYAEGGDIERCMERQIEEFQIKEFQTNS